MVSLIPVLVMTRVLKPLPSPVQKGVDVSPQADVAEYFTK